MATDLLYFFECCTLKSEDKVEETHIWKKDTTLPIGDSILFRIREDKLCNKSTIKVTIDVFPGAKIDGSYHCAIPLINKKLDRKVFYMGKNNAPYCTAEKIVDQILEPQNFYEIITSTQTLRGDNTIANKRNNLFVNHLKKLTIKLILNYRGLHLRMSGAIKLSGHLN